MEFGGARRIFMGAEYDTREGDVPADAVARRLEDVRAVTDAVVGLAAPRPLGGGAVALDLGCGAGTFGLALARATGAPVRGLDLSAGAVAAASRAARGLGLARATFAVGDFERDALPSFDAAVLAYALSLADDPARALANVARAMRPGARVVVFDAFLAGGPLAGLDGAARAAGLAPDGAVDLTDEVRALAARGAWPWSNAPAAEARFAARGFRPAEADRDRKA